MDRIDDLLGQADVITSSVTGGEVRVNIGDAITGDGIGAECGWWGLDGFVGRPNAPDADGSSCQVLYQVDGTQKRVIASRDNRYTSKNGALAEGDRAIVSDCNARLFLKKESDAIGFYGVNALASADANSMLVWLDGSTGIIHLTNSHCALEIHKDKFQFVVTGDPGEPGHTFVLDKNGLQATGTKGVLGYGTGCLGVMPDQTCPNVTTNAIAYSVAGPANLVSTSWTVAT